VSSSKKILIIAPFTYGYTAHIKKGCQQYSNVDAEILYLDYPVFQYRNFFHGLQGHFSRLFLGKNFEKNSVSNRIKNSLCELGHQDEIFIIRPDLLSDQDLNFIKSFTKNFIAYYWDSTRRFPRKVAIIPLFDKVYSFDRWDVEKYNFSLLTNYIFKEGNYPKFDYQFFNISTYDNYRFPLLENVAKYLKEKSWSYSIQVHHKRKKMSTEYIETIRTKRSIQETSELIQKAKILLEIQNPKQIGLSFRVFEALGYRKKLMTTNQDIVNYDFYNPQNILVLDINKIEITEDFVSSPYVEIDEEILSKYKIENWVKPIFKL